MQKLSICVGQGQEQGVGGKGLGSRGGLKLFTSDCSTHIAVGRDVGLWGWGNDGGGEGGGEGGWGEALIEVLNKTGIVTLSLVVVMHITGQNRPKIVISRGFPRFWQGIPLE